jgi:hypothetical protein
VSVGKSIDQARFFRSGPAVQEQFGGLPFAKRPELNRASQSCATGQDEPGKLRSITPNNYDAIARK